MGGVVVRIAPAPGRMRPRGHRRPLLAPRRPRRRGERPPAWVLVVLGVLALGVVTTNRDVVLPATEPAVTTCAAGEPGTVAGFTGDQLTNAASIVAVGREMNVPQRGWVVGVATAMQESALRNLNYGDRDSLGLFQQRPSMGWGSPAQVRDPRYAARKFYDGLLGVPGWERLPVTVAAQAVQRSGFPGAYAKWEGPANQVVAATTCTTRS